MNHFKNSSAFFFQALFSLALCLAFSHLSQAEAAPVPESQAAFCSQPVAEVADTLKSDSVSVSKGNTIYGKIDQMPSFPGGERALRRYLARSVHYPKEAQANGVEGRVFVKYVIATDGSVVNVRVVRPLDPFLDREAERVVRSMPKWTPGMHKGKPIRVQITVPINFVL